MITLVIIGVIAAITVPTLIVKYQKEQTVTRLKKAYSSLAQTTARAIADNGPIKTWEIIDDDEDGGSNFFNKHYLLPYLSISKDCGNKSDEECLFVVKQIDGSQETVLDSNFARFFLSDGTFIATRVWGVNDDSQRFITIRIDINGPKGPNRYGKDIFKVQYHIRRDDVENSQSIVGKFLPEGFSTSDDRCSRVSQKGDFCAKKIMQDGWQIKDDYPW